MLQSLEVNDLLQKMSSSLADRLRHRQFAGARFVGIRTGGEWLANRLHQNLVRMGVVEDGSIGSLDISFYRDDFTKAGLNPMVRPSSLPFETEGQHIVLIDDVVMSGRTIRAAMNELFDYGRPASITLAALIDVDQRELPIQPDVLGRQVSLLPGQRIKLKGPEELRLELVQA